jgi:hypothetical protein
MTLFIDKLRETERRGEFVYVAPAGEVGLMVRPLAEIMNDFAKRLSL